MSSESRHCAHPSCTCPARDGDAYCSDHCEAEVENGRLQEGPCHCGHDGCGASHREPAPNRI